MIRRLKTMCWIDAPCTAIPIPQDKYVTIKVEAPVRRVLSAVANNTKEPLKAEHVATIQQSFQKKKSLHIESTSISINCQDRSVCCMLQDNIYPALTILEHQAKVRQPPNYTTLSPRTVAWVQHNGWHLDYEKSLYRCNIKNTSRFSPKLPELGNIINGLEACSRSGIPEKLAILYWDPFLA